MAVTGSFYPISFSLGNTFAREVGSQSRVSSGKLFSGRPLDDIDFLAMLFTPLFVPLRRRSVLRYFVTIIRWPTNQLLFTRSLPRGDREKFVERRTYRLAKVFKHSRFERLYVTLRNFVNPVKREKEKGRWFLCKFRFSWKATKIAGARRLFHGNLRIQDI